MQREFCNRLILWMRISTALLLVSQAAGADETDSRLDGTDWRLVEFQSMDDTIGTQRPQDASLYTMSLKADGSVALRLNCNRAMGTWSAESSDNGYSGRFEFGPLATTRAMCPPPSMDQQISSHARYIRSYLIQGKRLYLSLMADAGIYVWEEGTLSSATQTLFTAPENGGPRNWEVRVSTRLNLREHPSTRARVISRYSSATLLDNLGCQHAERRTWCDVQQLDGGPRGYVAAEFLKPARSPDGSVTMGPDDSALRAGQGRFDAQGQVPCAQFIGQPMMSCAFGVARAGGGYATVVIKLPDGSSRAIFFRMGKPIGADTSQADGYPDFRATRENDLHMIRIGDERYEITDAVILGG